MRCVHVLFCNCCHARFALLCQFAFSQYVIPTYFLTLPNSVREEMFGITLHCDLFMLDSLLVCRRNSHGLSLALCCFLVLGPAMPTVHVTVHPQGLYDFADIFRFVEHHSSPRWDQGSNAFSFIFVWHCWHLWFRWASFESPLSPGFKRIFIYICIILFHLSPDPTWLYNTKLNVG